MLQERFDPRRLSVVVAVAMVVGLLTLVSPEPAAGNHDGPPLVLASRSDVAVSSPVPQVHPLAGNTPMRFYGSGFEGTTQVRVGGVPGFELTPVLDFRVYDSGLLTVALPPAPAGFTGFAHIEIVDDEATFTTDTNGNGTFEDGGEGPPGTAEPAGIMYADANLTLDPAIGLSDNAITTARVTGYGEPGETWPLVQINPLVNFLEDSPLDPDIFPPGPAYGDVGPFISTDADGNSTGVAFTIKTGASFNPDDKDYDPNATCPVSQETADRGLPQCFVTYSQFGKGSVETYFASSGDPVPAAPTLSLSPGSVSLGDAVTLSGANWNASPFFGSDTIPDDPGETILTVELCDVSLTSCTLPGIPDAGVELTRYRDSSPGDSTVSGQFSGATLTGSFTPSEAACAPDCVVRVRQNSFDPSAGVYGPDDSFIEATATLTIGGGGGGGSTSSSTSTTLGTPSSSTSTTLGTPSSSTSTTLGTPSSSTSTTLGTPSSSTSTTLGTPSSSTSTTVGSPTTSETTERPPSTTSSTSPDTGGRCGQPDGRVSGLIVALAEAFGLDGLIRVARLLCRFGL